MTRFVLAVLTAAPLLAQDFGPGRRVLLDAHNCYPEKGQWSDRIERALAQGLPVAIEQDLLWFRGRSILSHDAKPSGTEPGMKQHFFERVRPVVEAALRQGNRRQWPLIVLNLDFKSDEPEHHRAVWELLGEYESWLTTAPKTSSAEPAPLDVKPLLVLTGVNAVQEKTFHDAVPAGGRLRVFGAARVRSGVTASTPVDAILTESASNYRRWWNNPWSVVEAGGQNKAGDWTRLDEARLRALVREAHARGLWIRFYTLNGHGPGGSRGWTASYDFGSEAEARKRWRAAARAGVDFIATDQYEQLRTLVRNKR